MRLGTYWWNRAKRAEYEHDVLLWLRAELRLKLEGALEQSAANARGLRQALRCEQCRTRVLHYHEEVTGE